MNSGAMGEMDRELGRGTAEKVRGENGSWLGSKSRKLSSTCDLDRRRFRWAAGRFGGIIGDVFNEGKMSNSELGLVSV